MKKLIWGLIAIMATLVVMPMFAAFEAHVINVTAQIENALFVHPESLEYGTVFPQEHLDTSFFITFSQSFSARGQTRVGKVDYVVKQKPQCLDQNGNFVRVGEDQNGNFVCPEGSTIRPLLCAYLSKHPDGIPSSGANANNDQGVPAFHDPLASSSWALGKLVKLPAIGNDPSDTWTIDLAVPCFRGQCAQEWPGFVRSLNPLANPEDFKLDPALEHETFGCDLWVEVTRIY